MSKGRSSNCVYLDGQLQEVITQLKDVKIADLRDGQVGPIVQAVLKLETIQKTLPDMV